MSVSNTRSAAGRYFAAVPGILASLLVLSACSVVNGSGHIETETRPVSGFTGIDLAGSGEVTIEQGASESLTIEADDNVLPELTSEVSDSTLKLGTKPGTTVRSINPIRYRVSVKELTALSVSGSGTLKAPGMKLGALHTDISGSGRVTLSGSADQQDIDVSGSGQYEAADLPSQTVNADVSGSGDVVVAVSGQLKVDISGSGTVTYTGEPKVESSISGSGKVTKK